MYEYKIKKVSFGENDAEKYCMPVFDDKRFQILSYFLLVDFESSPEVIKECLKDEFGGSEEGCTFTGNLCCMEAEGGNVKIEYVDGGTDFGAPCELPAEDLAQIIDSYEREVSKEKWYVPRNNFRTMIADVYGEEPFETEEELEDWVNDTFDEIREMREVLPGLWYIDASNYNGHPYDHDYWEGFYGLQRVRLQRVRSAQA